MKKSISSLLALAMLLAALSACGSKPSASSQQPGSSSAGSSTSQQQPGSSSSQDTPPAPAVDTMILKEADDNMINTYTLLAVNPDAPFSDTDGNAVSGVEVNTAGAQALIQWLLSDEGMAMAADYGQADYGDSLFYLLEGAPAYTGEIAAATDAGYVTESCKEYQTFTITRRQFAELAVNYLEKATGKAISPAPADTFADTADESVLKAYAAGIVRGVGEGRFSPGGLLTREQLAAMLWRAMEKVGVKAERVDLAAYTDGEEVSSWAADSLSALVGLEVMAGTGANALSPKDSCTVEQAILLVYRAVK